MKPVVIFRLFGGQKQFLNRNRWKNQASNGTVYSSPSTVKAAILRAFRSTPETVDLYTLQITNQKEGVTVRFAREKYFYEKSN